VSLNRTRGVVSLGLEKRRPLDVLAKRAFLKTGRGDWHSFETDATAVRPFVTAFCGLSEAHLLAAARLGREPLAAVARG